MKTWQELQEEAKALGVEAKAFHQEATDILGKIDDGEFGVDEVKAMIADAKGKRESAAAKMALAGEKNTLAEDRKAMEELDETPFPADDDNDPDPTTAIKAASLIRYGEIPSAIKAVLTDLHGPDFNNIRWEQMKAFNAYIRNVKREPSHDDERLMKMVIFNPDSVKAAILMGVDVRTLKATMIEAADVLGGYVVPVDFQNRVIERIRGMTVMRGRATMITTSRDVVEIPKATGGDTQYTSAVRVTWVDETPTAGTADTNLTFGMEKLPINTVMAETFLSRNLIEDAAFDLAGYLAEKFAEAGAIDEDNQFITGDGVGKPTGLLPGGGNPAGTKQLTEANSGAAGAVTWDGLIDLAYSIASQYRQNAVWIGERLTLRNIRKLKDGNGRYLWEDNQQDPMQPPRLMGFPVLEQETLPTIAANAYPLLFGDPRGYTIADRIGATIERYLDASTARTNSVIYIMRQRKGGQPTETYRWAVQKISA